MGGKPTIPALMQMPNRWMRCIGAALGWLVLFGPQPVLAEAAFTLIPTQYIAALGDPGSTSGTGAEAWGLWAVDPGPRGVRLSNYETLKGAGGVAPAQWTFDGSDWWLEEHGLIMERPSFPIPPGRYVVTGGREVTAVLTIHPKGDGRCPTLGTQRQRHALRCDAFAMPSRALFPGSGRELVFSREGAASSLSCDSRCDDAASRGLQQAGLRSSHRDWNGRGQVTAASR